MTASPMHPTLAIALITPPTSGVTTAGVSHSRFAAAGVVMARLLLAEFGGPRQN